MIIKKEFIWLFYLILTIAISLILYFISKNNKFEYAILGIVIGLILSLLLWVFYGKTHSY